MFAPPTSETKSGITTITSAASLSEKCDAAIETLRSGLQDASLSVLSLDRILADFSDAVTPLAFMDMSIHLPKCALQQAVVKRSRASSW